MTKRLEHSRRQFLRVGASTGAGLFVAGSTVAMQIGPIGEGEEEKPIFRNSGSPEEMSPAEDLMREHGVLNRILLIYAAPDAFPGFRPVVEWAVVQLPTGTRGVFDDRFCSRALQEASMRNHRTQPCSFLRALAAALLLSPAAASFSNT